jgi:L-cysteine S-thiosulfotransferase
MVGSTPSRPRFSAERRSSPEGPVARIERSEIRGCPINAARPFPGFACAQPGLLATGALAIFATLAGPTSWANAEAALRPYTIVGDAIPASLTGVPGDPVRGKGIVASRQTGLCLLCHSAPLPEEKFQGTIGPDLTGAGSRNTEGQLRLRIVEPRIFNPDTIMPAYYRRDGLTRVAPAFRGKTVLTAEEIEDVVAFLMTLR